MSPVQIRHNFTAIKLRLSFTGPRKPYATTTIRVTMQFCTKIHSGNLFMKKKSEVLQLPGDIKEFLVISFTPFIAIIKHEGNLL